jgi:outer membrane receptor protein involved in Fe transport
MQSNEVRSCVALALVMRREQAGAGARGSLAVLCSLLLATSLPSPAAAVDAGVSTDAADTGLEEITVTAEKYNSTIQNTPISLSAMSGEQLDAAGITSVEALAREVPGLSVRSAGPAETEYEARGLASNGGAAPTVGFYLDEVPLSPPTLAQAGKVVIDPNLYDVSRIEVLRGPQGTLYGSGSMGGTIKVITNQPKLGAWEGSVQGTLSDTEGGSGNGGGSFMVNIPIGEQLALRLVATDTYRSGWIDRVVVNPFPPDNGTVRGNVLAGPVQSVTTNVNTEKLTAVRGSLLYQVNEDWSVLATVYAQNLELGGYDLYDSPPGPAYMAHYEAFNIPEPISDMVHIYSVNITGNLGFANFTSATSYWNRNNSQTQDASESISSTVGFSPYIPIPFAEIDTTHQFSQEFRLNSRDSDQLHWTAGAFYSNLRSVWFDTGQSDFTPGFNTPGSPAAQVGGIINYNNNIYKIQQYALFADGSYKITDTLKLEAGLRWYRYQSSQVEDEWGLNGPQLLQPAVFPKTEASNTGYNPRINLSYEPTKDLTTYVSASKGFRPGGANQLLPTFCGKAPLTFGPDSVWDYEVGEKARMFDNRLTINSDFYYIKWSGIQQAPILTCGFQYDTNAGNGRSFGPEIEINAKLSSEFSVTASGSYTDARLTHPNAAYTAFLTSPGGAQVSPGVPYCATAAGCTAPILNVPKSMGSVAATYTTEVFGDYKLTGRLSASYVGPTIDEAYLYDIRLGGYTLANARLILARDKWSASLFVDNLTNKVAAISANNTSFQYNIASLVRYSTNQPRTYGTEINYHF